MVDILIIFRLSEYTGCGVFFVYIYYTTCTTCIYIYSTVFPKQLLQKNFIQEVKSLNRKLGE